MPLLDLISPLVVGSVVVWRIPKAVRDPKHRPLTVAFLGLMIAAILRMPQVETLSRETGLAFLLTVPKHLAGVLAAAAVLDLIAWSVGHNHDARARRVRFAFAVATAAVMLATLPFVPRSSDGDFALGVGGSAPALTYWIAWLVHLGFALVVATGLFFRQARQALAGRLRYGLAIGGVGTVIGLCYVVNKMSFMVLGFAPGVDPPFSPDFTVLLNSLLFNLALFLIIIGTTLPAPFIASAMEKVHDLRNLRELRPLWKAFILQNPDVVLESGTSPQWYRRRFWDTRLRLYRYTIEIRDGALTLRGHMQDGVDDVAHRAVKAFGVRGEDAEAFVEACRWSVALRAKAHDVPGKRGTGNGDHGRTDLAREVRWLCRVARWHRSSAVRRLTTSFPLPTTDDTDKAEEML